MQITTTILHILILILIIVFLILKTIIIILKHRRTRPQTLARSLKPLLLLGTLLRLQLPRLELEVTKTYTGPTRPGVRPIIKTRIRVKQPTRNRGNRRTHLVIPRRPTSGRDDRFRSHTVNTLLLHDLFNITTNTGSRAFPDTRPIQKRIHRTFHIPTMRLQILAGHVPIRARHAHERQQAIILATHPTSTKNILLCPILHLNTKPHPIAHSRSHLYNIHDI
mmetsp:Transcript_35052/g.56103  ORF Transcript_35052/g.56103 Transcript_35052/m.56103 type:complete len:222 (-) Transcript_35052:6-671(-)